MAWEFFSYPAVVGRRRSAAGLKDGTGNAGWTTSLLHSGYTVFAINHRAAPRFRYPAAIEDVQRAIRYIRHHAMQFGIDGRRRGGFGGSSGAHLVGLQRCSRPLVSSTMLIR
jgi:hypothetical protein